MEWPAIPEGSWSWRSTSYERATDKDSTSRRRIACGSFPPGSIASECTSAAGRSSPRPSGVPVPARSGGRVVTQHVPDLAPGGRWWSPPRCREAAAPSRAPDASPWRAGPPPGRLLLTGLRHLGHRPILSSGLLAGSGQPSEYSSRDQFFAKAGTIDKILSRPSRARLAPPGA